MVLRIQVLGHVAAWHDREPLSLGSTAQRAVLGLVAVAGGQVVPRTAIMDVLWPDRTPPASAVNVIQTHVLRLRRQLEPDRPSRGRSGVLVQVGDGYALRAPTAAVDLLRFRQLVESAERRQLAGDPQEAAALLDEALGLWHGPPLADIPALAGHPHTVALAAEQRVALARYGDLMIALGSAADVLPKLEQVAAANPLDEVAQARLIRAYGAAGRRGQAFTLFGEVRRRLVEELGVDPGPELVRAHTDLLHSVGSGKSADDHRRPAAPAQLPAAIRGFTGRVPELARLHKAITGSAGTTIVAVSGTAGVGKTALAVHWAHQVADQFPDGQIFLDLRGFHGSGRAVEPAEAVRDLLDALQVPEDRVPVSVAAQTALFRSLVCTRQMLFVLDNARDTAQVRPLLPGGSRCLVLVTSRNQLAGLVATDGAQPVGLDLLDAAESRDLLAARLGADRVAAEAPAVADIVNRCAGLPLALAIVAARAATNPHFSLRDLAGELCDERIRLDALGTDEHGSVVRSVFSWSYRALGPAAATMFRRLGSHPGPAVSLPAAASLAGLPASDVRPALAELTRANLVTEPSPGRYSCHDLLHAYAAEIARTVDGPDALHAARGRMIGHYLHTARTADRLLLPHREPPVVLDRMPPGTTPETPEDRDAAMRWFAAEHRTLVTVTREAAATGFDADAARLAWTLCTFFQWRGHWHDQAITQRLALRAAERLGDDTGQAHARHHLGRAHAKLSRPDDAQYHYRQALHLFGRCGDHAGQGQTHLGLGALFEQRGDSRTALRHALRALDLFRLAGNLPGQANAMNSAGWCHVQLGHHEQAIAACQEALALQQEIGDRDGEAATWDSLGYAHHSLDRFDEAAACYQRAIDLRRDLGDRYYEAASLHRLGDTRLASGDPAAAAESWRAALDILDALGHADSAGIRGKLASCS
ncbi:AfsR/SARP family transcriptional regulator [Virgisporangium ochraceum]|uniref:SARP family transcriptional regulator n=1 Tax=Virgisporangium ochraceum TaxID=65505 RepID=A0A8J3ZYZ5_9ACTN|nr:BTAD domain-containing putative transcriptional regulator [Virgisporangium ochraceum]GIJ72859.1 SARP family transcriptional regulator [Virgisporangium ochraceum]